MIKTITSLLSNRKTIFKAVLGLSVAILLGWGIILHQQNKKLSERLETAFNDIEAYQGIINDQNEANNVLLLEIDDLANSNDELLQKLDSVRAANNIKKSSVTNAATQTQIISVNGGKGVEGDLTVILKDSTYTDSIQYNPLTKVYYTIGKDTVNVQLDIQNTQYLYAYTQKEYKNKKNFIKRLLTLDFKKIKKNKYTIINTNDAIKTSDVRVIEIVK